MKTNYCFIIYRNALLFLAGLVLAQCNFHLLQKDKTEQAFKQQTVDRHTKDMNNLEISAAAERGDLAFFERQISNEMDYNIQDNYGWSPLLLAARNHHTDVMRFLLRKRAAANYRTSKGISALHLIVGIDNTEIVKELLTSGLKVKDEPNQGCNILIEAATHGANNVVKTLLSEGIGIKCRNEIGENILMMSWEKNGGTKHLDFLLAAGAEINVKNNLGESPLYYQVRANRTAYVATLLKHGALAQDSSNSGTTLLKSALLSARATKDFTIYNLLKQFGATH